MKFSIKDILFDYLHHLSTYDLKMLYYYLIKMAYIKLSMKQNFEGDPSRSPQAKSAKGNFRFRG